MAENFERLCLRKMKQSNKMQSKDYSRWLLQFTHFRHKIKTNFKKWSYYILKEKFNTWECLMQYIQYTVKDTGPNHFFPLFAAPYSQVH